MGNCVGVWREVTKNVGKCVRVWVEVIKDVGKCRGSCWESSERVYGVSVEGAGKCGRRCGKVWGETFFRKMSWSTLQYQHRSAVYCCNSKLITNSFPCLSQHL